LASEEARKKRTFFPEDVIDSNFHTSLLSGYPLSPWERVRVRENKKSFIHSGTKDTWRSAVPPEL
jgi:hypothetical protein